MHKINMDTIVQDPNPVLRQKAKPVSFPLQSEDIETIESMLKYVRDSRVDELAEKYNLQPANGIAAPQIGISKQMTVIVIEDEDKDGNYFEIEYALINPRIVSHAVRQAALSYGEGCLSIQKVYEGLVPRSQRIKVEAYDYLRGENVTIVAKDFLAIVLQHEIDHLNGVLFYDHINKQDPWAHDDKLKIIE
ncbi:peptide deformylase [Erysipelothrix aquatica]|uniref:peptide deformylase n=1 Tax=Erysipelothrix aquatica TaxID=2683714 RepID=UPI00135CBE52|nr:peptide deformylase [Erysipelothrix aquatica]